MRSAEEWYQHWRENFWMRDSRLEDLFAAIQADALEAAALDLERSLVFAEANAPGGLGVPPQEQKWVDSIRKLKEQVKR